MLKGKAKCVNGKGKRKGKSLDVLVCLVMIIIVVLAVTITTKGNHREEVGYIYDTGNTVWEMAVKHCPEGMEINRFAYEIEKANDIVDGVVYANEVYKIPVYETETNADYLNLNTVASFEVTEMGLSLYTFDGNEYIIYK